ncbi:FAD-binding oxidoreductase [Brevundimonas sp. Root1279]|uniref:FAD-binding oxidoreductase n=1 Tax=Brevundimonas sp. Root1279 TaxID=1736443 RepID=UPI0006FAE681|nr:FAD-binding oxidoreductase [Brevundimonas sp. Root1279]KQW79789.1 hydroxyacid dehydrogenase [Brevundimonas sp. Root1279]
MTSPSAQDFEALKAALGSGGWTDDPDEIAPWLKEWRNRWSGHTPLMLTPCSTDEVARAVAVCAERRIAVVPQGGDTGLVGGQIPYGEVLLSTRKLRAVRDVTPFDDALTVEAGVTLLEAQQQAAAVDRMFPLSLAAEGSATIGGVISTNAGGTAVLRYGVMRDLVLGIEAVMPDGEIFHGLKRLRKDNTGYDLKQLLIGAEGTLGVVTAATLKLFPVMRSRATAVVGLETPHAAIELLARAKAETGGGVEAFELMKRIGVEFALKHIPDTRELLDSTPPWYVLIELVSGEPGAADAAMERLLTDAFEAGLIIDAAIAQNDAQRAAFWKVREEQSAAQKPEGGGWKHDVSVPVSRIADFLDEATAAVERFHPGARVGAFGHVGDGNLHYDVLCPPGGDLPAFLARWAEGSQVVHDIVAKYDGSISAEHGLGRLKTEEARRYKSPLEIRTMQAVRAAIDPHRIMNPAVLF